MPAYHLMSEGGGGITLVNIGVGPSNAKTICDHIAVLRPHVWLMIGHCGGLRPSQTIGDYVLPPAYPPDHHPPAAAAPGEPRRTRARRARAPLRRDGRVRGEVLRVEIPLPGIAEVQKALFEAAIGVTGEDEDD